MSYLSLLLAFKIGVTLVLVSAPLLLLPAHRISAQINVGAEAVPWLRLYGVAVTAILVGYAGGFWTIAQGAFPWGPVIMGIASNVGAAVAMIVTGLARRDALRTAIFGFIGVALIGSAIAPEAALRAIV